jgi:benzodiazapine receptor
MAMTGGPFPLRRDIGSGALAIVSVAAACIAGQVATTPNIADWYDGLVKPSFNPPNWIFAPVWSALYVLMAIALWRLLRLPPSIARSRAIALFFVQLFLNASWSWLFFAAHSPLLGLVNIVPQWLIIVATVVAFHRLDPPAGWCLVPLATWVAFAAVLNASIFALNG